MGVDYVEVLLITIFYSWPEEMIILCLGLIFLSLPINFKKVVPYGILLGTATMAARTFLPYGIHGIVLIVGMCLIYNRAYDVSWVKCLLATLTSLVIVLPPSFFYAKVLMPLQGIDSFEDLSLAMNLLTAFEELLLIGLTCLLFYWLRNYHAKKY